MNKKNYNLATPELIEELRRVGAHAYLTNYRVAVTSQFVMSVNALLTGSKLQPANQHKSEYVIYSKDVCNALLESSARRSTYGHVDEETPHPHPNVRSFTFSDGQTIQMCPDCTEFDTHRRFVLCGGL